MPVLEESYIQQIEINMHGQTNNPVWGYQREGCITASIFYSLFIWVNTAAITTSSLGLFPIKMSGAGKGPGIGWSRV